MKQFSINHLEQFSGIKAHTIRMWEQRYELFTPHRTEGNTRLYSFDDLQKLLNISVLLNSGKRISQLAILSKEDIERQLHSLGSCEDSYKMAINHLILYKHTLEVEKFEDVLDSCVLQWDIDVTLEKIIFPLLQRTALLAYPDRTCETHFAITAIRRKIILGIEKTRVNEFSQQIALLFLPEGEHYDLMLLYMAYVLKRKGIRVLYLGTNVPVENLKQLITQKQLNGLYTFIPQKHSFKLSCLIPFLEQQPIPPQLTVVTCEPEHLHHAMDNVKFVCYKDFIFTMTRASVPE
jgi:DNA-binding transcriptional MerR regulator